MKAIVVEEPGGPGVLTIREIPDPKPGPHQVLIRVRAFGLNRAELFTRQGHSPGVRFPRIIGIECVGQVVEDTSGRLAPGQTVATMMGGMGRDFDGSYAEYTVVPSERALPLETKLSWEELAAIPEMYQTANGSLKYALRVQPNRTILIRGGTSSVGMTAIALAKQWGLRVFSTTRKKERTETLIRQGSDGVFIDGGEIATDLLKRFPEGVDYVLELIGTSTLNDSLSCLSEAGIACMTGILAGKWELNNWNPMEHIPNGRYLTSYSGAGMSGNDLQEIVRNVEAEKLPLNLDRSFAFEEIAAAHEYMENNRATGKVVVVLERH